MPLRLQRSFRFDLVGAALRESRACLQPARIAEWSPTPDPWRLESGPERIPQCTEGDQ